MNYNEAIAYINSYTKSGAPVSSLSRFSALMERLGNPHKTLRAIHVAGTNGKGSVCQYIACGLQNMGLKTGKFTSPFIMKPEERIQINEKYINEDDFAYYAEKVKEAADQTQNQLREEYSQFEIFTAMMFLYFAEQKVDFAVVETGIGGLLDCTNVLTSEISVITSIDFDHMSILGNTIEEIAAHKAGIIKRNSTVVTTPVQNEKALAVIRKTAGSKNSVLIIPRMPVLERSDIYGNTFYYGNNCYKTGMCGEHQIYNAVTAGEALKMLGAQTKNIAAAFLARLPARLQVIRTSPLLIIDGAHNPSAVSAAVHTLGGLPKLTVVTGFLKAKDYRNSLHMMLPLAQKIVAVDFFAPDAVEKEHIAEEARKGGVDSETADNIFSVMQIVSKDDSLVIGSLYLASQMLNLLEAS